MGRRERALLSFSAMPWTSPSIWDAHIVSMMHQGSTTHRHNTQTQHTTHKRKGCCATWLCVGEGVMYGGWDVFERPYTIGGGGVTPPGPPPPPPLPKLEADSQNSASAPSAPRGFQLKNFRRAFGRDHRGTHQPNPLSPPPLQTPPPPLLIHPWCHLLSFKSKGVGKASSGPQKSHLPTPPPAQSSPSRMLGPGGWRRHFSGPELAHVASMSSAGRCSNATTHSGEGPSPPCPAPQVL